MNNVLIRLEVPVISKAYDVWIPSFLKVQELIPLLIDALEELSGQLYKSSGNEFLCYCKHEFILSGDYSLDNYGVQNGDHLMLL